MREEPSSQRPWLPRVIRWIRDRPERISDWIKVYWFRLVLLLAALVYLGPFIYQAVRPGGDARYQVRVTREVPEEGVLVSVAYPRKLRLGPPGENRAISVLMQEMSSVSSSPSLTETTAPNPTPPPALTIAQSSTSLSLSTSRLKDDIRSNLKSRRTLDTPPFSDATTLPVHTPTNTPRPWIVSFSSSGGRIMFADRQGTPVAPQLALTPGVKAPAQAVIYAQRAPMATSVPTTALQISVAQPDALVSTEFSSPAIELESGTQAFVRHFLNSLCGGPAAPLTALAVSLVAFAIRERRSWSEQRREEKKKEMLAEVELLANLASRPREMIERYWQLKKHVKVDPEWKDDQVIRRLEEIPKQRLMPEEVFTAAAKWFGELEDDKAMSCLELTSTWWDEADERTVAFRRALRYVMDPKPARGLSEEEAEKRIRDLQRFSEACDDRGEERINQLLAELVKTQDWDRDKLRELGVSQEALHWLALWPAERPSALSAVCNWLERHTDLQFNPFGPERAELDPRLPSYGFTGVFERARGRRSIVMFGQSGSGKTAAARLIAHQCQDPLPSPCESGSFPVYWSPVVVHEEAFFLQVALRVAEALARYLARRADGFTKLSVPGKHSVVRLLSLWAPSANRLEAELQRAGTVLGAPNRLIREMVAVHQEPMPDQYIGDFPSLLSDALPDGFEALYLIIDLSSRHFDVETVESIASSFDRLLNLTDRLADERVYIKLFLPTALRSHLRQLSTCEVSTLTWSEEDLKDMLKNRIRAAEGDSLTAFCGPDVSDLVNRLIRVAEGCPRRLVCLGNQLLLEHARRAPEQPTLSAVDVDRVLGAGEER